LSEEVILIFLDQKVSSQYSQWAVFCVAQHLASSFRKRFASRYSGKQQQEKVMEQTNAPGPNMLLRVCRFYLDGFRRMTLGRTLWKIIIIKLIIIFAVLKFFFFPDFLGTSFTTDKERGSYVLEQITRPVHGNDSISGR
jgi:hypothetical protein